MRRRLIVMRHAKSSWDEGVDSDHERPLNDRGRRDAPRVAARLAELGWTPEVVISSDSVRTRETFDMMRPSMPPARATFLGALYHGGTQSLRDSLASVSDDVATVLALGHNPGWEQAIAWLSGEHVTMKTASAALLQRKAPTWQAALAEADEWKLVEVIHPKEIE